MSVPLCRPQLGDERVGLGAHLLGGLHKLDSRLVDDLLLFHVGDSGVGDTPLDDDRGGAPRQRRSRSDPSCSGNEVSIWAPPREISMMAIG